MTQKQEDTFGPKGSNPNPELYKAIKEKDDTPLEYSQAVATGYVSTRDSFKDMFDKISAGTVKAIEGLSDPETQANRLQDRIDSREARANKKGADGRIINKTTGEVIADLNPKRTKFDKKTSKLKTRQKRAQEKADAKTKKEIELVKASRKNDPEDIKKYENWLLTTEGKNSTDVEKEIKARTLNIN
jgi:hypothetical protein